MLSRFHLLPERNGRTDGQTDGRTYGQTDLLYEYRTSISFRAVSCFRDYSHVRRSCELRAKCYDLKNVHAGLLHRPMMLLVASYSSSSSFSCMHVMNHNWSATKQRLHPQSVAEISRHSVFSGDRIRQCGTSSGSRHMTQISVCKSPFPSAGTAVSLFRAKTVQQRPLLPTEVETRLPDCGDAH